MTRGQNYNVFVCFVVGFFFINSVDLQFKCEICHNILPLEINNTFFRNIHLCKIKCHLFNKTEHFDFSIFPALR